MPTTLPLPPSHTAPRRMTPAHSHVWAWLARAVGVAALVALPVLSAPAPVVAQGMFGAALYVNDAAITNYEIDQRRRFLEFIGAAGGNARERAIERLIEDRLQVQEARRLGLRLSPDQLNQGLREFAARAEITVDEMLARMARDGIDRETFVDFIRAGLLWRDLVQGRFGAEVRITDAQIEQAMSIANVRPQTEILISELFLPSAPEFAEAVREVTPQILAIRSIEEFGNAARQISAAPSAAQGGRVTNWIALAGIPEPLQSELADAREGRVIGPVEVPGAVGFFMLRARRDTREVPAGMTELEYRRVGLPGGRSPQNEARAAAIRAQSATCADFGAVVGRVAPELPPEAVSTITRTVPELPAGVATELARINPGQVTANLVESGELSVIQLCARRLVPDPRPSREEVRQLLINRALEGRAEVYLRTLRAEAEIRRN